MEILKYIKDFLSEDDSEKPKSQPNNEKIWKALISLANDHLETFGTLFSYLNDFSELYPSFKNSVPQAITDSINSLSNSTKEIDEQIKISHPLIVLGPFLPTNQFYLLINNVISIIQKYLDTKKDIPVDYLNFIDNLVLTSLEPEVTDKILTDIKNLFDTPKGPAAIAFLASISADYYQIEPNISNFIKETAKKYISKQEYQLSVLFLILRFFNTITGDKKFVKDKVIPLIDSQDENICHIAGHTIIRMIKNQLINNVECLDKVISLYPHCQNRYFFKVIKTFILLEEEDEEKILSVTSDIGEKVKSFIMKVITETKDSLIKAYCIDIIGEIGQSTSAIIEDCYKQVLDISIQLINEEQYDAYPFISYYFISMIKNFESTTNEQIKSVMNKLVDSLNGDQKIKNLKKTFELASNIAEISEVSDLIPQVTTFVLNKLCSSVKEEKDRACGVILTCPKKFSDSSSTEFCVKIVERASTTNSVNEMGLFMMTLHKLMKHHPIPESVFQSFTEKMLEGKLPVLFNEILPNQIPIQENLFDYLGDFVTKYPTNQRVIQQMNEWIDNEYGFRYVCSVLVKSINAKSGSEGLCTIISQKVLSLLQQSENFDGRKEALSVLIAIYNNYPACLSPFEDFVEQFSDYFNDMNEEEEDFGDDEDNNYKKKDNDLKISIVKFFIDIYSSQPKIKVDMDTVLSFFDYLPFEKEKQFEDYLVKLNNIILNDKRFDFAKTGLASLYADIIIPEKGSFAYFKDSNKDLIKKSFSTLVKNSKSIEKTVRNQIGKSASSVQLLDELLSKY